jgi:hypothetical protein
VWEPSRGRYWPNRAKDHPPAHGSCGSGVARAVGPGMGRTTRPWTPRPRMCAGTAASTAAVRASSLITGPRARRESGVGRHCGSDAVEAGAGVGPAGVRALAMSDMAWGLLARLIEYILENHLC